MGMFEGLPLCAHNLIKNNEWKGGGIVRLDNALSRPSAGDVAINYHMLKPLIPFSPDKARRLLTHFCWKLGEGMACPFIFHLIEVCSGNLLKACGRNEGSDS